MPGLTTTRSVGYCCTAEIGARRGTGKHDDAKIGLALGAIGEPIAEELAVEGGVGCVGFVGGPIPHGLSVKVCVPNCCTGIVGPIDGVGRAPVGREAFVTAFIGESVCVPVGPSIDVGRVPVGREAFVTEKTVESVCVPVGPSVDVGGSPVGREAFVTELVVENVCVLVGPSVGVGVGDVGRGGPECRAATQSPTSVKLKPFGTHGGTADVKEGTAAEASVDTKVGEPHNSGDGRAHSNSRRVACRCPLPLAPLGGFGVALETRDAGSTECFSRGPWRGLARTGCGRRLEEWMFSSVSLPTR